MPSAQLPGQTVQDQTCLWTRRSPSQGPGSAADTLDLQSLGKPQLPLSSDLGTSLQGKRKRGSGGPGWQQEPYLLPGGLPSPPGPQGCQDVAWPQPAPPTAGCPSKGSCHKQSAPLRGPRIWAGGPGEGSSRSQSLSPWKEEFLSFQQEAGTKGLEADSLERLPELPAHPRGPSLGSPAPPSQQEALPVSCGGYSPPAPSFSLSTVAQDGLEALPGSMP